MSERPRACGSTVVVAVQAQAGRQLRGRADEAAQDGVGLRRPAAVQVLADPPLGSGTRPRLSHGGEVDETGQASDPQVPYVSLLFLVPGSRGPAGFALQAAQQLAQQLRELTVVKFMQRARLALAGVAHHQVPLLVHSPGGKSQRESLDSMP
jgi:hypothetical protein